MSLENTINQDIKAAMLAKSEAELRGLRAIKSALLIAKTEKGASEANLEDVETKVLQKLVKQRKESADIYKTQNREDLYKIEAEEIAVIEKYLPKQMTQEELTAFLKELIATLNVGSIKEMGRVIGAASKQLAGKADGRAISETVKSLLA